MTVQPDNPGPDHHTAPPASSSVEAMLYLAESLAALESAPTLSAAVLAGLTCVAAHLHAPVGAILEGNDVLAVVGLESSRVHPAWWHAPAGSDIDWQREPGDGIGPIIVVPIPSDPPRRMVLAHPDRDAADGTGFGPSEVRVAQCLADILAGSFARLTERVRQMETEHRLRQIIETVGQAVWVFDADGRTSYANDKMAEILGYGLDQLAGLTLFDVLDETGKAQAARNLERRRLGSTDQLECCFIRADGTSAWVQLQASPLYGPDSEYAGSMCLITDVSQRLEMELVLQDQQRQLSDAQRVARLGSWEWDAVTDRLSCSEELYRILGIEPGEVELSWGGYLALVHPDDRPAVQEEVRDGLRSADAFGLETRLMLPDGQVVWVQARGEVVRDETGSRSRMRGTVQDINASKLTEEALRETTARYQLLQRMANAANEASTIEEVLQVAVREICAEMRWVLGFAFMPPGPETPPTSAAGGGEEVRPHRDPVVIWYASEPDRYRAIPTAINAGVHMGAGMRGRVTKTHAPAWISDLRRDAPSAGARLARDLGLRGAIAFPVLVDGALACVLEFFSRDPLEPDASLLETMAQVATQLGRVAERQRANEELATARDAAMEASLLKSDFLATMSHEIRTPMNGVIGLTGLLLRTDLDERQRQYAEGVESAGEGLLMIINDILDFSKIEAGRLDLEVIDFDLVVVMEEAGALVAGAAQRKGLELASYCYPDVPVAVRGDPARLRQVLLNLASNAVKFTGQGEVIIRAGLPTDSDNAAPAAAETTATAATGTAEVVLVRFEVADTGIGISDVGRARLFEPFTQVDASTTRQYGGTGLGLAISRRLVAAMGGMIGVESVVGGGSTFWFTIPLARQVGGREPAPRSPIRHFEQLRVLVVDDNATNRTILRDQLGAWGIVPDLVDDAESALAHLERSRADGCPVDLALVDAVMPGMDGWDMARRVVSEPAIFGDPRLVMLTSAADVGPAEWRRAGISACLTKPVRMAQLYECLRQFRATPMWTTPTTPTQIVAPGERGHILVVEDNTSNQMVAVGILRTLGFRTTVAANGFEALAALGTTTFDAVLMDCQMPDMDGYAATAQFRSREQGPRLPVIAMTAGATVAERDRCMVAGMDDYLSKPVRPRDVDAVLTRWLNGAAHQPSPRPPAIPAPDTTGAGWPTDSGSAPGPDSGSDMTSAPGSASEATDSVLDPARLDILRAVGPPDGSFLSEIADTFLRDAPKNLASMRDAVVAHDLLGVQTEAHRLKGQAGTMGATTVATLCAKLEESAVAGHLDDGRAMVVKITLALDRASVALRLAARPAQL